MKPCHGARIASSCSDWMVATMSRICGPRARLSAAISAPSPTTTRSASEPVAQQVVLDPDHPVARAAQHPTTDDLHRVDRGRPVERLGRRRPPVDHQGLVVDVADPDPADVADLTVGAIQPTEHQTLVLGVQHGETLGGLEREHVALVQTGAVLLADEAAPVGLVEVRALGGHLLGGASRFLETGVDEIHVRLLDGQLVLQRRLLQEEPGLTCVTAENGRLTLPARLGVGRAGVSRSARAPRTRPAHPTGRWPPRCCRPGTTDRRAAGGPGRCGSADGRASSRNRCHAAPAPGSGWPVLPVVDAAQGAGGDRSSVRDGRHPGGVEGDRSPRRVRWPSRRWPAADRGVTVGACAGIRRRSRFRRARDRKPGQPGGRQLPRIARSRSRRRRPVARGW